MKLFFLVATLFGLATALQYPVEYWYQYEGRVATGIPSIRPQLAALGIRAKVILQMKAKTQGIVKLNDVEVAERNEDLGCSQIRRPIPFKFSPMPGKYKQMLEEPFAVYFQEEMDNVLKVPKADLEFVTNIRKSVVEMLRIEPVVANLGGIKGDNFAQQITKSKGPEAFTLEEESIHGRCEVQYSLQKLPQYFAQHVKRDTRRSLQVDEQNPSSKSKASSLPTLKEQYYRLERAINFDKCNDRVVLQHAGLANLTENGRSQFKSVQARSSVGSYILKGEPGAFRIERAIIEGDVALNPFGYKTYRLQTITNQTLTLEKAQPLKTKMQLPQPLKSVKTWRFEVASPYTAPTGHPKPWVNYYSKNDKYFPTSSDYVLLGLPLESPVTQEYKRNIMELLNSAVEQLYTESSSPSDIPSPRNTKSSAALTYFHQISRMMRAVPLPLVQQIFTEVFNQNDILNQRKQVLLVDMAAASGAAAPIKVLLDMMKKGQISNERIGTIFITLPNNVVHPSVIPDILEFVKTMDIEKNPILTSTVLINFASLAERVCLNPKKFNYSIANPVFGNQICRPSEIINNFLPFLKQKLQQAHTPTQRSILIQAVSNLAIPQSIPILKPYVYGKAESSPRVRCIAIYGLTKRRLPQSARRQAFDILMEIVDNIGEHPQVRQAAFISMLTWKPHAAWYQQMARRTWREPLQSFAAYMTFTFESIAKSTEPRMKKQAEIAAFVLPLLKPYAPSLKYSYHASHSSYDPVAKIGLNARVDFIQSLMEIIPSTIYTSLRMDQGRMQVSTLEAAMDTQGLTKMFYEMADMLRYPSDSERRDIPRSPRDRSSRQNSKMMDYITKNFQNTPPLPKDLEATLFLREFDNMYQYITLDRETISKVAGPGASTLLQKLHRGIKFSMTKFLNPVDIEYFFPTEIGLPLTGMVHMPIINVGDAEVKLVARGQPNPTLNTLLKSDEIELLFKTNYKYASKLIVKLAVPAPWNKKVVEAGVENLREINLPVKGNLTFSHSKEVKNMTFTLTPHMNKQTPIMHGHNLPYTEIRDFIPSTRRSDLKVITVKKSRQPVIKLNKELPRKYTGMDIALKYSADVSPVSSGFLFDLIRKPERLIKVILSPTSKQYQYSVLMSPSQDTKSISVSMTYINPFLRRNRNNHRAETSLLNDAYERLQKTNTISRDELLHAVLAQVSFRGQQYRQYELASIVSSRTSEEEKIYSMELGLRVHPIPHYTHTDFTMCTNAHFTTPNARNIEELRKMIRGQMQATMKSEMTYGKTCKAEGYKMEGKVTVSPERKEQIKDELDQVCNYDHHNPLVELQTAAVYDRLRLNVEYKQHLPNTLLNLTYQAQEYLEGFFFPHAYFNNLHRGEKGMIRVEGKRPLSSKRFTFNVETPEKNSIFSEIRVPDFVTQIVPWSGLHVRNPTSQANPEMVLATRGSNECRITSTNIHTYDSVNYEFTPLHCWTIVAVDRARFYDFIVYTRQNQNREFEVFAHWPKHGVSVIFSKTTAMINGVPVSRQTVNHMIKSNSGENMGELFINKRFTQLKMFKYFTINVRDTVEVFPDFRLKNILRGLCGDFDGEQNYEFTGPKNCTYDDKVLFKFAYTIPEGKNCNTMEVKRMHMKIEEFQKTCYKRPNSARHRKYLTSLYESKVHQCYKHVYPVQRKGTAALCISERPVQLCTEKCKRTGKQDLMEWAKCWMKRNAPKEVKEAQRNKGFLPHPINDPAKFRTQIEVSMDSQCRRT